MKIVNDKKLLTVLFISLGFVISFFVHFYNMPGMLFFGYEQGRDAQIIHKISELEDFILVGPKTDIGGVFHGPWFYYLMVIPYFLGQGSPVFAIIFINLINSIVPIIVYLLAKKLFKNLTWAVISAIITMVSFELVIYSRWLSNVSMVIPFLVLSFYFLWLYREKKKSYLFLLSAFFAVFASQFEIILIPQFVFVYLLLFILKIIPLPSFKTFIISIFLTLLLYSPLILFDFRNNHISINSLFHNYILKKGVDGKNAGGLNTEHINLYISYFWRMLGRTLFHQENYRILSIIFISIGSYLALTQKKSRVELFFILIWCFMSLPLVFTSSGLDHLYVGSGVGWILLAVLAAKSIWQSRYFKFITPIFGVLVLVNLYSSFDILNNNNGMFFRTVQDNYSYKDQISVLEYIHQDANGQKYKFDALTIPYFQPEAWNYLNSIRYPTDLVEKSSLLYVVIEPGVSDFWEKELIKGHGNTKLLSENKIGALRIQKRIFDK